MSNNYVGLRRLKADVSPRCAERLLNMRKSLASLRKRKSDSSLLLATWNIRDFDSNKFGFGPRLPETFFYIAEILSCFDLVAVQEVARDLSALERVMAILGREWDYIATDTTEGASGNAERMAFVYNTEKVWFRKIAGEVVLPDGQLIVSQRKREEPEAEAAAVEAGEEPGSRRCGSNSRARPSWSPSSPAGSASASARCTSISARTPARSSSAASPRSSAWRNSSPSRQDKESTAAGTDPAKAENYVLLGDFNVVSPEHKTMQALKSEGFTVPAAIDGSKVRTEDDHFYDQIAVRVKDPRFKVVAGGMVDIYQDVFRNNAEDRALYAPHMPASDPEGNATSAAGLYRKWRTWQMSDHKPLWVEIETDFADDYLKTFAASG